MRAAYPAVFLFVVTGLCGVAAPAAAQTSVGVKAGGTIGTIKTVPDDSGTLDSRADFAAGVFVVPRSGSSLTMQVEALVNRRGAKLDADVFGFGLGEVRLTYVDISTLVRLQAGMSDLAVYAIAGPTLGIKLDAEFVVLGFSPSIDGAFKDTDFGVTVGGGFEKGRFLLEARYMHGFKNIVKAIDVVGLSAKNRMFTVLAGVRF